MIETTLWHPVLAADTPGEGPVAARLLGEDLVLWREGGAGGPWRAFVDRCPHRGTRLSLGRVCGDGDARRLECPYHGWRFDARGRCTGIPALPRFTPPAGHAVRRFASRVNAGLVWVRLDDGDDGDGERGPAGDPPAFPADADPRLRKLLVGPVDVATSAPRIVENFLDLSHFAFVHEGGLGDREHAEVADYRIEPLGPDGPGFAATGCVVWQPRRNAVAGAPTPVSYRYEVPAPYTALLEKLPATPGDHHDVIGLFVCPVDPEASRVWFRLAVSDHDSTDEALRAFQHAIFEQDRPVLESQRPKRLPLSGGELHCAADRSSVAYRRMLEALGVGFGVC